MNASTLLLNIAEQNITSIERIQNRFKLKRFIGINLIIPLVVAIILLIVFLSIEINALIIFLPLIICICAIKLMNRQFELLVFTISMEIPLIYMIYYLGSYALDEFMSNKVVSIGAILIVIMLASLASLFFYGIYHVIKNIVEKINDAAPKYMIRIQLINANLASGELLTINRKGDYIIRNSDGKEILIKNNSIATVSILNDSEIIAKTL
ncbi:hypothetical protein NBRC13296_12445 [Paenibacillus chitinolyticus]|uniref:hypothetical protein n=1 Tax=Paenibacillus chitinolyticus TaxID=79263 RepID=UPI003556DF25